jgi:hypothetical protein
VERGKLVPPSDERHRARGDGATDDARIVRPPAAVLTG